MKKDAAGNVIDNPADIDETTPAPGADGGADGGGDPNPAPDIKSTDDVRKVIEKVRTEEKKKLYPQIEHHKKMAEQAQKNAELLQQKIDELESEKKKKGDEKLTELQQMKQELVESNKQIALLKTQQEALITESKEQIRVSGLQAYKAQKLAEAGTSIIPELVFGESEAEIDAAIIASKSRYNEIYNNARKTLTKDKSNLPVPSADGAPSADAARRPSAEQLTEQTIRDMPADQWARERLNIRRQINSSMKEFFGTRSR